MLKIIWRRMGMLPLDNFESVRGVDYFLNLWGGLAVVWGA